MTCIWTPLAIIFKETFHEDDNTTVDWVVLDSINNGFWALAFFINLNRVDIARKLETCEDIAWAYLKSPFLIPDALCVIGSVTYVILDDPITAKGIELIRLFHYRDALFPIFLLI